MSKHSAMETVTVYSFLGTDWTTMNPTEAFEYARDQCTLCFANDYEFANQEVLYDYRPTEVSEL